MVFLGQGTGRVARATAAKSDAVPSPPRPTRARLNHTSIMASVSDARGRAGRAQRRPGGVGGGGRRRVRDATDPSSETATHREMGALPTLGSSHCARSSPVPCLKLTCFSISLSLAFAASRSAADMGVTSKPALLILVAPDAAAMVWEAVEAARLVLDPMTAGQRRTQAAMLAVKSALARHARIGQLQVVR